MKIVVSKDIVKIENNHSENHYGEYNVNECTFQFDDYFNNVSVKRAVFTSRIDNKSIEVDIINNKCMVPSEILKNVYDEVTLGVYGYEVSGEELLVRYSPTPDKFVVHDGSYKENTEHPEIITPAQYDIYSQALQEGLSKVDDKLVDVEKQGDYANIQGDYAKEQGDYAKDQGTNAKNVADNTQKKAEEGKFNGKSLEFVWQGTKLGVRLEGQDEYQFVDLQGVQGEIGATGEPFKIKKTYASVSEMNADFGNMKFGDYVMIASSVDVEDNAKLYTRGESAWIFISDFSGAMGIRGETGLTPNIKIGEVKTLEAGSQAKVTRSGSNEEPVFNFELPKGDKGDDYVLTEEDKVEIGEKVNTEYEKRIAENEKDIVDIESYLDNLTPKSTSKGELVHITDALGLPTFGTKSPGQVRQFTTTGKNKVNIDKNYTFAGVVNITNLLNLVPNTEYIVSCKDIVMGGEKPPYIRIGEIFLSLEDDKEWNFTTADTITSSYMYSNGPSASNSLGITSTVNELMIRLATISDNTYEPYTGGQASPNPEFPQEIEVIEGDLSYKVNGKNLFDKNNAVILNAYFDTDTTIITADTSNRTTYIKCIPNTTYTISLIQAVFSTVGETSEKPEIGVSVSQILKNIAKRTITTSSTAQYIVIRYRSSEYTLQQILDSIQVELGSVPTEIEPYQEQIVPLDLKGNWVGKINDSIKDYLVTDKKKLWLVKNVDKVVLDGSEEWYRMEFTQGAYYYQQVPKLGQQTTNGKLVMSNCFKATNTWSEQVTGIWLDKNMIVKTAGSIGGTETIDDFKTFLSENKPEVYYSLATPEIIELGELPEPIKTFEGVNNIQLLANLDTEIEVMYALDVKKYYDNKLAEISAQII